jgi:hypothetical protein
MKKAFKLIGIVVMLAAIGVSMAACNDDSGNPGGTVPGGTNPGGSLSGSGVVWDIYDSGGGYVFRNGTMHVAVNIGGTTWWVDNAASYKYNNTHILYLDGSIFSEYSISGNTLSISGIGLMTKRTGQTLQWMDY